MMLLADEVIEQDGDGGKAKRAYRSQDERTKFSSSWPGLSRTIHV